MAIRRLPGGQLILTCDTPGCTMEGPTGPGVTDAELLGLAEERGWHIEREWGLHYCPLTTMHDCAQCGAPTRSSITDAATGEVTYCCERCWPDPRSP